MATAPQPPASNKKSFARRAVRAVAVFVVLPYLALVVGLMLAQRSLLYHPLRDASLNARPAQFAGCTTHPVAFKSGDGVELHGWHIVADHAAGRDGEQVRQTNGRPVVLYFCGNAHHRGGRLDVFELLLGLGADVVCFDYRGYGDNMGSPSEDAIASDAREIWKFLVDERHIEPRQIVICGESMGGGVATRLAAEMSAAGTPPGGLVLRSTFSRLTDVAAIHCPWLPVRLMLFDRYPSLERIPHVTCPILILHGQRDTIVPFTLGEQLSAAAPLKSSQGIAKEFIALKNADHNDVLGTEGEAFREGIRRFLEKINPGVVATRKPTSDAMLTAFMRKLTYFPDRAADLAPASLGLPVDRVHPIHCATGDGLTLNGWHLLPEGKTAADRAMCDRELASGGPVVLFFSGNGGNRAYRIPEADLLMGAGAHVFLFDYRGYGDNPGEPSEPSLAADAHAIWQYATDERQIVPGRIVLYGESLGGAVAVRLAAELCQAGTPPAALIARSTFTSLADVARHHYPLLPVKLLLEERYASIEQIPQITCLLLVLHGRRDSIVPYAMGRKLFEAAPEQSSGSVPKRFVELLHADHNDVIETDGQVVRKAVSELIRTISRTE